MPKGLKPRDLPRVTRPDKAIRAILFIQTFCTHVKGRWAGVPFMLLAWQFLLIWTLFGACTPDGLRQYRTCYCEIPKKNGKSELAAAVALIGLVGDDEIGAEVYSAAGDRGQASLVFDVAAQMVRNNKTLSRRIVIKESVQRMIDYRTNSFYKVLSAESFTKHGINPSMIIFDELHAQPNSDLWDVLTEGTDAARDQQIIFAITTAGAYDPNHICWQQHEYAMKLMQGIIEDDSFLPIVYGADKDEDNWESEEVWKRCNPSMGHIFELAKFRREYKKVLNMPTRINNFKRFRLNMWVSLVTRFINMPAWDACAGEKINPFSLRGRTCYGGLDLASKIDIGAFVLVFPPIDGDSIYEILPYFWIPEESMRKRSKEDRVPYEMWVEAGLIDATPGNVIDYGYIYQTIDHLNTLFDIEEVPFDRWGATQIVQQLDDQGLTVVQFGQGFGSMAMPTKELEKMILSGEIHHGGNPVLRWMASNLVVRTDPAGNHKPDKARSAEKIDGIVALIMGLDRALRHQEAGDIGVMVI